MLDQKPTVFVVDPDPTVRASLEESIRRAGWSALTFASAGEFLSRPRAEGSSCLLLELPLPDLDGVLQEEAELQELRTRYDSMSGRERQVMARVVTGQLNKQVGAALGISIITVKAHRGRVMRKMAAGSLAELVTMALQLRLPVAGDGYAGTNRHHRPMAGAVPFPRLGGVKNGLTLARGA